MRKKQAVVLIHGIGEQRPMDTLRGFIDAVWVRDSSLKKTHVNANKWWSKPDRISNNHELRRYTTAYHHYRDNDEIKTEFFEFYWAHLMSGTTTGHLVSWIKDLAWRSPRHLSGSLFALWCVMWGLIVATILVLLVTWHRAVEPNSDGWTAVWAGIATTFIVPLFGWISQRVVGDAARYLSAAPANVESRSKIRTAGVELIDALHDRGYDRIVVVGHSLGSVIGYDVLTLAWANYHQKYSNLPRLSPNDLIRAIERDAAGHTPLRQTSQRELLEAYQADGHAWRVTDFVSLGSPLAHSAVLLARSKREFERKTAERELPTSPPVLEANHRFTYRTTVELENKQSSARVPNHGALFAVTRWSNLFSRSPWLLKGDFISGECRSNLGRWIVDVPVSIPKWLGYLTHTHYWSPNAKGGNDHLRILRQAINLRDRLEPWAQSSSQRKL